MAEAGCTILELNQELVESLYKVTVAEEEAGCAAAHLRHVYSSSITTETAMMEEARSHNIGEAAVQEERAMNAIHELKHELSTSAATAAQEEEILRGVVSEAESAIEKLEHKLWASAEAVATLNEEAAATAWRTQSLQHEVEQLRAQLVASQNDVERLTAELLAERAASVTFSKANAKLQLELMQAEINSSAQPILKGQSEVAMQEVATLRQALAVRNQEADVEAVVGAAQTDALDKQSEDLQRRRNHLLERLRSENVNMTSELGRRRALLTPCRSTIDYIPRSNIDYIPHTTRRLFDRVGSNRLASGWEKPSRVG